MHAFCIVCSALKTFPILLLTGAPREKKVRLGTKIRKLILPAAPPKSLLLFYSQMLYQASPLLSPLNITSILALAMQSLKEA